MTFIPTIHTLAICVPLLGTPLHTYAISCTFMQSASLVEVAQCTQSYKYKSSASGNVLIKHWEGVKCDFSDLDSGMVVGASWAALNIPETAELLGFSCLTASRVYTEWQSGSSVGGNTIGRL